ncbi:MAG: ATP synthase F1 subunit gamma [Chloroflexi bacterium CG08_land_8_20_14_0_20_45_12]|nr:MAG: ATP synthase F1 subunit gamma [Chloroflexi bacterium CG08_land_8_20_14_0_20_45_12]
MATIQVLRRRIRSIQGTAKICRAMEMIATAKLKRTQQQALAGRPYAEKIHQVIADLAVEPSVRGEIPPLLQKRAVKKIAVVHITTDRGLCGGLNANLNRVVAKFILEQSAPVILITIGRKGRAFAHSAGLHILAEFTGISDRVTVRETLPISRVVIESYGNGDVDLAYLAYPRFISTMVQKPTMEVLLPVEPAKLPAGQVGEYIYEPNPLAVLNELLPRFIEMQVYHAILELIAGEQSARMVAMRNASDNAEELIKELALTLNKVRQESITKEICDISGGTEALA